MRVRVSPRFAGRASVSVILTLAFCMFNLVPPRVGAQQPQDKGQPPPVKEAKGKGPTVKLGLSINDPKALQGYTLVAPPTK